MIPQSAGSSSSNSHSLSTSNSRLSLILSAPPVPAQVFHPGETIRAQLNIKASSAEYTSLILRLKGETVVNIMGHERWQMAQMTNVGMGGNAMLVTSMETCPFLDVQVPLVSQDANGAKAAASSSEKKKGGESPGDGEGAASGGMYEFVLPEFKDKGLLPSFEKKLEDMAGVEVRYYVELHGTRKGMFKTNDKLTVDLPVGIVAPPISDLVLTNPSKWPFKTIPKALKFKGNSSQPELTVNVTIAHQPLTFISTTSPSTLPFTLSISSTASSASSILLSYPTPTITSSISRKTRTTPIVKPENGREYHWAGVQMGKHGKVILTEVKGQKDAHLGEEEVWKWTGEIEVPVGQKTVECPTIGLQYFLNTSLSSPAFGGLNVAIPLFIPSSNLKPERMADGEYSAEYGVTIAGAVGDEDVAPPVYQA